MGDTDQCEVVREHIETNWNATTLGITAPSIICHYNQTKADWDADRIIIGDFEEDRDTDKHGDDYVIPWSYGPGTIFSTDKTRVQKYLDALYELAETTTMTGGIATWRVANARPTFIGHKTPKQYWYNLIIKLRAKPTSVGSGQQGSAKTGATWASRPYVTWQADTTLSAEKVLEAQPWTWQKAQTFSATVTFSEDVVFTKTVSVEEVIIGTPTFNETVTFTSEAVFNGTTTFNATIDGSVVYDNDVTFNGTTTFNATVDADGQTFSGAVTFSGTVTFSSTTSGIETNDIVSLQDHLSEGSGHHDYYPMIPIPSDDYTVSAHGNNWYIRVISTGAQYIYWALVLPTSRGAQKLYIDGYELGVFAADANDYVTAVDIDGINYTAITNLHNDATDRDAPAHIQETFTAVDCSGYELIRGKITLSVTSATQIKLSFFNVRCYYD